MPKKTPTSLKVARASLVIGILALIGIFIPELVGIDGFDGGFAISFFCIFVTLSALLTAIIFWGNYKKEQKIRKGEDLIAHWTYSQEEWNKFTKNEFKIDRENKKVLLYTIIFFAVIFGVGFWIYDPENGIYVFYAMMGLIVLMAFVAYYSIYSAHQKNLKRIGEVYISTAGIIINNEFYAFNLIGSKLKDIGYNKNSNPQYLEFEYSYYTKHGDQSNFVRIPVPKSEEKNVEKIIEALANKSIK